MKHTRLTGSGSLLKVSSRGSLYYSLHFYTGFNFSTVKNYFKKETKSRAQLPDTNSLTGFPALPGTGSWGRAGWSQCRRSERLCKNAETKEGPESGAAGPRLVIFPSNVTEGKINCFVVWPIPNQDKEDVPSGSQAITETCQPKGKMRRNLCQSNPLWVQNELTTPRPRTKNGVLLLQTNELNNLKSNCEPESTHSHRSTHACTGAY